MSGKLGGAPDAACKTGWARAQRPDKTDDCTSKPPAERLPNWPGKAPDPGAAVSRAISSLSKDVPAIGCGPCLRLRTGLPIASALKEAVRLYERFGFVKDNSLLHTNRCDLAYRYEIRR